MDLGISGRKAVVCGASAGLGFAVAKALVSDGVDVTIVARDLTRLSAAAEKIHSATGRAPNVVVADVTTDEGRKAIQAAQPSPDILLNNSGGPPLGDFRNWSREDWVQALDANMISAIMLIKAFIDGMTERHFGRIVNITSLVVKQPVRMLGLSNGARAGLTGFVSGLAREVVRHNVTINNILPGQFDTDRLKSNHKRFAERQKMDYEEMRDRARKQVPARRFGDPDEIGALCAFLCSERAGFITAQNFVIDGGEYPGVN
jgi:3-oxoacyl-[acyl-carrier protein] reductase